MLWLRERAFGSVLTAAGALGIFGEGYLHHSFFKILFPGLFTFNGVTLVPKTFTLERNKGFMPLKEDGITPANMMPGCIITNFPKGYMLNSVGLSNFGAEFYLDRGIWQKMEGPLVLSFMSVKKTREERMTELTKFVALLKSRLKDFKSFRLNYLALQINFSCPNVGHDLDQLMEEVEEALKIAWELGIPLMPKFNILLSPNRAVEIANSRFCDAICVSNTVPWGMLPDKIDWKKLFGSEQSPLEKRGYGKGGLSGAPLTPLVQEWVREYYRLGGKKPLNAGGGIMDAHGVNALMDCGAPSIFIGSVVTLRPWRLRSIIKAANGW